MTNFNYYQVPQSHVGLLYEDGVFVRILDAGKHEFKRRMFEKPVERYVHNIDLRERSLTIKGQEILTADKVAIRVSLLVYYRVTDAVAAAHNVASYEERIYEDVQLAARRFLANRDLEAILSDRNEISDAVREDVRGSATVYGVEIIRADIKDLVFPGNLREIMNQVLETERRAEAKLIQARKDAEAQRIQLESMREAELHQLETEKVRIRATAKAEREKLRLKLEADIEQARALAEHPDLARLRQLEVLTEMARSGAKFVLGLSEDDLTRALDSHPIK
ncbi:MAG: slipin family protein [Deltaproteobacteria bacterium]|nr:slipin family protein [Deltaproteobacteria bacterium]